MLHCTSCEHANTAQSNFCSHCGASLVKDHSDAAVTTTIVPVVIDDEGQDHLSAADEAAINELPRGSALLIAKRGGIAAGERYLINEDATLAGRHPDCPIFLDDITVSRHHAELVRNAAGLHVRDLGSLNGTYVNRELIDGMTQLRTGDEVQIGKFRMVVFVSSHGLQ